LNDHDEQQKMAKPGPYSVIISFSSTALGIDIIGLQYCIYALGLPHGKPLFTLRRPRDAEI